MSNNCNILFTLYAISLIGEIVAFVSQYPKSPKGSVILFGVLLLLFDSAPESIKKSVSRSGG